MKIILYTHPTFTHSESQIRFAQMLADAYLARGHSVEIRRPAAYFQSLFKNSRIQKWLGYVDQYIVFPLAQRQCIRKDEPEAIHVICDQALSMWVFLIKDLPHVIHCHDFTALRAAVNLVPQIKVSRSGKIYQKLIRRGVRRAKNFISISNKTQSDLVNIAGATPVISEVVLNGLNYPFTRVTTDIALAIFKKSGLEYPDSGYLLHVGGGQWYKNTEGVFEIANELANVRRERGQTIPELWLVAPSELPLHRELKSRLATDVQVRIISGVTSEALQAIYSQALISLFPSHYEGYGWPIAEAISCDCPVITTAEPPMTQVGGSRAKYVRRLREGESITAWAHAALPQLEHEIITRALESEISRIKRSQEEGRVFKADFAIESYLRIYSRVLENHSIVQKM